jgi:SAM-dependent methyltransferase
MDPKFNESFDLVTITIGVLSWMPDLDAFITIVARMIKPGGALFIYEHHPILMMIKEGDADDPVTWDFSYFNKEPYIEQDGIDYYTGEKYDSETMYSFTRTMSEEIMAGIKCGLNLEHFEELPGHISNTWWNVEKQGPRVPMSYTLVMRKPV